MNDVEATEEIEYWRNKVDEYKWLYEKQKNISKERKDICEEYRKIIDELRCKIEA
jgi:hypothetical protein